MCGWTGAHNAGNEHPVTSWMMLVMSCMSVNGCVEIAHARIGEAGAPPIFPPWLRGGVCRFCGIVVRLVPVPDICQESA